MTTQPNFPKHSRILRLMLVFLVALITSAPKAENSAGAVQRNNPTVIFAVNGEPGDYHMDAVAFFNGRQFTAPFSDEQKNAQKNFGDKYFAVNRKYRLIFGGGEAGTVTLKKWSEGCNSIHSEISLATSARLGGQVRALATNSESIGKRASSRRAPTEVERAEVLKLVRTIYRQRRTPANLIDSIKVTNLVASDLDGDGRYEMIGSFTLAARGSSLTVREGAIKFERDLFLIAKSSGTGLRADFINFQAYQPPPEAFLSSIDFIDQLDVDGDGVSEVFAVQGGFDGYGYLIFKKTRGRWRDVYQGLGDLC